MLLLIQESGMARLIIMFKIQLNKNIKRMFGPFILFFFFIMALFAPWIAPFDLKTLNDPFLSPVFSPVFSPGNTHLLGTNDIGQDIFSELIFGARVSLLIGIACLLYTSPSPRD